MDLEEEVVVISGGARGLGLCVAEIYGMRGGSVAVLDLEGGEEREEGGEGREGGEERGDGVRFYQCDVGDRREVEKVWARIVAEVNVPPFFSTRRQ